MTSYNQKIIEKLLADAKTKAFTGRWEDSKIIFDLIKKRFHTVKPFVRSIDSVQEKIRKSVHS